MKRSALNLIVIGLLLTLWTTSAFSYQQTPSELTLEQAIHRAKYQSKVIKQADLEVDKAHKKRSEAAASFSPSWLVNYVPGVEQAYNAMVITDLQWKMAEKNSAIKIDSVEFDTYKKYFAVQKAEQDLEAVKLAFKREEKNYAITNASYEVGLSTPIGLLQAKLKLELAKTKVLSSKNELEDAYDKLNTLLGYNSGYRPKLVSKVEFKPLPDELGVALSKALGDNPQLWVAKERITVYERQTGLSSTGDLEVDIARVQKDNSEEMIRELVRSLYFKVKNLESSYESAQKAYEVSKESYNLTKIKYELGMVTEYELINSETSLLEAKNTLEDLKRNHKQLLIALEKPWVYSFIDDTGNGN